MAKYRFVGHNADGYVELGGIRFDEGKLVEVADAALAAKLEGNGEFENEEQAKAPKGKRGKGKKRGARKAKASEPESAASDAG